MELLELVTMQRALAAATLVAIVCSLLGVFVVTRRLSFLGDGLAHSAFGGVALGIFLGSDPLLVALPFTLAIALAIAWTHRRSRLSADTAIGIFFSLAIALGIILIHLARAPSVDLHAYLFGDVLYVSGDDLAVATGVAVLAGAVLLVAWPRLAYATFDPELALLSGVPVRALDYLLFALVALIVVVGVRLVGILLVSTFLILPAASARLVARSLLGVAALAVVLGVTAAVAGLFLAYALDVPAGATMVLFQGLVFALALAWQPRAG